MEVVTFTVANFYLSNLRAI